MTPKLELQRLVAAIGAQYANLTMLDRYYEGDQPLTYMAKAMEAEVGDRISQVVVNWPRLVADAYESRLDVEGFRYSDESDGDELLRDIWQANNLDEESSQAHLDSLVLSRSYVIVGAGDSADDAPLVTVESPMQVYARRNPRTRRVESAAKVWQREDDRGIAEWWATLYLPDETSTWRLDGEWAMDTDPDRHELGVVPVVPAVNRPRIMRPDGVSELVDVLPLANAANKMATDMMVSAEYHAIPRRWVVGLRREDFEDANGQAVSPWSLIAGNVWGSENENAKMGQFPEADLQNFHNSLKLLAQLVAQKAALPPHYLGFTGDNPASADAIRSSETQLVKMVERKQVVLGGAWEQAMRVAMRIATGSWDERAARLETDWRDPSTPTVAQKADAAVKLHQSGVIPREQLWIDLGYTQAQRDNMRELFANQTSPLDAQLDALLDPGDDE